MAVLFITIGCQTTTDEGNGSNQNNDDNQDQNLKSYYFLRHAFMEENAAVDRNASEAEKLAWSSRHFNAARTYLQEKAAAYENRLDNEVANGNSFLKELYDNSYPINFDNGNRINYLQNSIYIDRFLAYNNLVYPYVLGGIGAKLVTMGDPSTVKNYEDFKAHYNALALRAYNDSLGSLRDSKDLPYNQERFEINYDLFARTDNSYDIDNHQQIETTVYNMLQTVANKTGTSIEALVDTVNMSLLHVSLWGARDLGAQSGLQLSDTGRLDRPDFNTLPYLNTKECLLNLEYGYADQIHKDQREYNEQQQQQNGLSR